MTNYKNTADDCIRWFDNNKRFFNYICEGLGITKKIWDEMPSQSRSELLIAVYHIFLQNQHRLNLN